MANLLTELFGSAIAGGLSGGIRANREEALLEERALAALMKEGKGYIPEQLLPFMEGYTRYPPEESQPFPWAEGESRAPGRRWTYAESAKAKAERERTEGYEKKLAEMPEHDAYNYFRKTLKYSEGESEDLTKKIFDIDELPWIKEEPEKPTEVRRQWTAKQVNLVRKMFESGKVNQENYKKDLSAFAQQIAEDEGFVKVSGRLPGGKTLSAKDLFIRRILQIPPSETPKEDRDFMVKQLRFRIDSKKDEWLAPERTGMDFLEMLLGGGVSKETPKTEGTKPPKSFYDWVKTQKPDEIEWEEVKAEHPDWDLSEFGQ